MALVVVTIALSWAATPVFWAVTTNISPHRRRSLDRLDQRHREHLRRGIAAVDGIHQGHDHLTTTRCRWWRLRRQWRRARSAIRVRLPPSQNTPRRHNWFHRRRTALATAAMSRPLDTTSASARVISADVARGGSDGSPIQRSVTCTPLSQIGPTICRSSAPAAAASLHPEFGPSKSACWRRPMVHAFRAE